MKKWTIMALLTVSSLGTGLVIGCGDYSALDEEEHLSKDQNLESREVAPPLRANSLLRQHNLPTGKWTIREKIPLAESWEKPAIPVATEEEQDAPVDEDVAANEPMVIMDENGNAYNVTYTDEELALVRRVLEGTGLANGRVGDDGVAEPAEDEFVPKAWSNGNDNRSVLGLNEYPLSGSGDAALYQRIGQLDEGCTATLVGASSTDYYYITAAHCLFAADTGNVRNPTFRPRRDSCQNKLGASLSGCDTAPYGAWTSSTRMLYQTYLDDCRGDTSPSNDCTSRDIAVVRVFKPSGEGFPGAFGFGSYSNSFIKDRTNYLRGYPNCGGAGDPDMPGGCASSSSVCRVSTLYGAAGDMGDTYNSGRRSKFGIDASRGQSGAGIYLNDGGNHRIFAVISKENPGCFMSPPTFAGPTFTDFTGAQDPTRWPRDAVVPCTTGVSWA